jgi:thioredoxin reductase (NADPH)
VAKPAILTVDDDPAVSHAITRDLRRQYGSHYQVVRATSGAQGLEILTEFAVRDRPVSLIVSDQRMPGMTGIELLEQAQVHAPDARLVLLTAYADTEVAIRAINDIGLDYYLMKPWDPPEEQLYPVLDGLLRDWEDAHVVEAGGLRVVGHRWSERSHDVKTFLARNHVPYRWFDLAHDEEAHRLQEVAGAAADEIPLVLTPEGQTLRAPSILEIADALGIRTTAAQPLYDLCIVGGGPAGLAAAVYGASEGLRTVVIERDAPGGQAGQSAAIENYLGFPKGLSGAELAHRAVAQARRFGAEMVLAHDVVGFDVREPVRAVCFDTGAEVEARAIVVATGVSYLRIDAPGIDELTGRGVYYGATASEARSCVDADVYVVGAANSAGQAALNLARHARRVVMLVRSDSLEKSMSRYLTERITAADNIEVRLRTEIVAARGDGRLETITLADRTTGTEVEVPTNWVFAFIGASPRTAWLGDDIARDTTGALVTGHDLLARKDGPRWPLVRPPFALETSVPGVFAAGDVRLDSMKRVASAVGEGAMSVYLVHRYLATM